MNISWRHIRYILTGKVAALTSFYLVLVVCLSIAAFHVVQTSKSGISSYNHLTEQSIFISNTLLNIRQEADETQAAAVRIIFNKEKGNVTNEIENIQTLQKLYKENWKNCQEWMESSHLVYLFDTLNYYRNKYNDASAELLIRNSADKSSRAVEFYYSHQMKEYRRYQQSIQYVSNNVSRSIKEQLKNTNLAVSSGSDLVNLWLIVCFTIMVGGSIFIARHNKKLLFVQRQLAHERQQKLVEITQQTLNAQEKERNAIGKELHDNVNQLLTVAKLNLSMAVEKNERSAELLPKSINYIQQAITEIRCLCKSLVSPLNNNISLQDSLRELLASVQDVHENTFFTFSSRQIDEDRLCPTLKLTMYRIVQEQINNILKHAEASDVNVEISQDDEKLMLMIQDNGNGFDVKKSRKGIGINNINNRVEAYHGTVHFNSSPGNGCQLDITFPLKHHVQKRRSSYLKKIAADYF